ncbi:hypothetical protein KSP39_PZI002512 [Platanthera zijinensis]|uniref:Reverse transcriptase domain-containing protein n=1 Tax=Platanthera zijinensis TaxID=2320716 RepID=A0AAP0BZG9_9ASPA
MEIYPDGKHRKGTFLVDPVFVLDSVLRCSAGDGFLLFLLKRNTSGPSDLVLAAKTTAASSERPGSRKSSVFSLFNLKSKSKFWSESVIRTDFDDIEGSVPSGHGKMEVVNYTKAGNIANFLKMSEVDSMYLPVPINFILIGFEGKGNHEFKLGPNEMSRWFTHIDHIFEHTRVPPIGEILTPFFKTIVAKSYHHLPLVSHVAYNFSVHAIQMGEKVTSVFEQAVEALSRKEDILDSRYVSYLEPIPVPVFSRADEDVLWQVDIDRMGYIFTTLIDYLKIENAYNIFILNPKYSKKRVHYGYRRGLSESEINFLKERSPRSVDPASGKPCRMLAEAFPSSGQTLPLKLSPLPADPPSDKQFSPNCANLKNFDATYQRMMDRVFREQKGRNLEVYVDDLLIKSKTIGAHLEDLRETFETLRKYKMRLNPKKCVFGASRGKFLGHLLTPAGMEPNPDKSKFEVGSPSKIDKGNSVMVANAKPSPGQGQGLSLRAYGALESHSVHIQTGAMKHRYRYEYWYDTYSIQWYGKKDTGTFEDKILQSDHATEQSLDIDKADPRPLYVNRPASTFVWTTTEEVDTVEWSKKCSDVLTHVLLSNEGKDNAELLSNKVVQMLYGKKDDLSDILGEGLKSGDFTGLQTECLTDTWIGANRWAFIDLSAGPFFWGPAVGGEGVRTEHSLPNVGKTIGAVAVDLLEISEDEAEDKLQDVIREKFSSFGDDHQAIDILVAEIDIYELFAFKHCKGRRTKIALCEELEERMHDLKGELEGYNSDDSDESHKKKALDALQRMEKWNLFSDTPEEYQSYTVAHDTLLAQLGATLWGSMRHVVAPSMADGAYHYYDKISFQLYFITQEKVWNMKKLPVNLKSVTNGLSSLAVASQKIMFSQHLLSLSEDPALAMAFSVARRAATVPLLLVNGTYRLTTRAYLDSSILQLQLQKLKDHGSLKGTHSDARSTLEVPIFWFIHNEPLLVDKHYQARSLFDMVIVVQSNRSAWESHLQCNGKSIMWDLRRPIKPALAATAQHLAGLLPLHLGYSHAHQTAVEDWVWSVGCNPISTTSQGWQLSQFQTDAIARNYIITSLEESILAVNNAIHRLVLEQTNTHGFRLFKSQERTMVDKYNSVVSSWRRIAAISGGLRYGDALRLLSLLEESSKGFVDHVNATISSLHPVHCTRRRKVKIELDLTTIPAFLVVFAILWFVFRPRRPKPKIN